MIGFSGLSHLGIVSSITAASKGFQVLGYHPDPELVSELNRGNLPVFEVGLQGLLENALRDRKIRFTHEISEISACDTVFVSVDVKTNDRNESDLSAANLFIKDLSKEMKSGATLVILSQVPPGYTRKIRNSRLQVYYQVETLIFGRAVERALFPERFIVGCPESAGPLPDGYQEFLNSFGCPILKMRYESAELAKISINLFLAASVTTTNAIAEVCEKTGAQWSEIVPALRLDKRIGQHAYLTPGLGISGGNIERDLATIRRLSSENGTDSNVIESFVQDSVYRKGWVLRKIHQEVLSKVKNPRIGIWGLAYKADTKSLKNSASIELLNTLKEFRVQVYDPQAKLPAGLNSEYCKQVATAMDASEGVDALIIMTPWKEFASASLSKLKEKMERPVLIDPFSTFDANEAKAVGFDLYALGRGLS